MRRCPGCNKISDSFNYRAWVVEASGTLRVGFDGRVSAVGPAVATTVVKAGKELDSKSLRLTCQKCGHNALVKHFVPVFASYFSNREGDTEFVVAGLTIRIHSSEVEQARTVFSETGMAWETTADEVLMLWRAANASRQSVAVSESGS